MHVARTVNKPNWKGEFLLVLTYENYYPISSFQKQWKEKKISARFF